MTAVLAAPPWGAALPRRGRGNEPRRLGATLLGSLLAHALLLSLSFGGAGDGLPGFAPP